MSVGKALVSGIEGRYAVALFELALEKSALDEVERDVAAIRTLLADSQEFAEIVASPLLSRDQQAEAMTTVARELKLGPLTTNFLGVLAVNRRLRRLAATLNSFQKLMSDHRGEVSADVISARALSDDQINALRDKLKAAVGQDVIFDTRVDENLLGGLVVKVGSRMIDSSLKTKLQNLRVSMKGVG